MYPVKANSLRVTSKFGNRTYMYRGKKVSDFHRGIDLVGGSEIIAFADGIVTSICNKGEQYKQGCYVRIKHDNGWQTLYYHLKSGSVLVNVGNHVKKGQLLGIMGATGRATGVHLHFQIDKGSNLTAIDPYDYVFNGKEFSTESKDNIVLKSIDAIATDVIKGLYGNYPARKELLEKDGYNYEEVQNKVNEILKDIKSDSNKKTSNIWIPKIGDKVHVIKTGKATSYGEFSSAKANYDGVISNDLSHKNRKYPYLVSVNGVCIGWYQKDALNKI